MENKTIGITEPQIVSLYMNFLRKKSQSIETERRSVVAWGHRQEQRQTANGHKRR